jgi:hypothetical protein
MDKKTFLINLFFHLTLIILVILMWSLVMLLVSQKQIVFLYKENLDNIVFSSRESLYFYPIVFVFIMVYNYLLNFLKVKIKFIDFINVLIFLMSFFICLKLLIINY